jgi:LPXTG-site transpeptidase (sortase) family protein
MKSSWWMILFGYILLVAGLANSIFGIRQTSSPFDVVSGGPLGASTGADFGQVAQAITTGDELLTPISGESPDEGLNPAQVYEEPDRPIGLVPNRLVISSIGLDAPIIPTKIKEIEYKGQIYYQWLAPNKPAVGWHDSSALLGLPGNTVLNGHHNVYGEVFKDLVKVHEGDLIDVYSGEQVYKYQVVLAMLLPERYKSLTVRLENARWILPTEDERLTLITCWPADSNTHRVIIVALPVR